jgi:hypothetical protein
MKLLFLFILIIVYIHIYLHFKINPLNEFSDLHDLCKQEVSNTCYYKLPFLINGDNIIKEINLTNYIKHNNKYIKPYDSVTLLEPYVKFFVKNELYKLKKNKLIQIHNNLECRNFYIIHKGSANITCIHPKYKDVLKNINSNTYTYLENNKNMLHVELKEKQILFIPNYWYVYIKAVDNNTIIEKINYSTILNQFTIWLHKNITKYYGI